MACPLFPAEGRPARPSPVLSGRAVPLASDRPSPASFDRRAQREHEDPAAFDPGRPAAPRRATPRACCESDFDGRLRNKTTQRKGPEVAANHSGPVNRELEIGPRRKWEPIVTKSYRHDFGTSTGLSPRGLSSRSFVPQQSWAPPALGCPRGSESSRPKSSKGSSRRRRATRGTFQPAGSTGTTTCRVSTERLNAMKTASRPYCTVNPR